MNTNRSKSNLSTARKDGSVMTRAVQMEVIPGQPRINTAKMLEHIKTAHHDGVSLLTFPEMAIPGYLIGDEWEHTSFIRECERCGDEIRRAAPNMIIVFGNVGLDWNRKNEDGRVRKYNALFVAHANKFHGPKASPYDFVIKMLLPNYREFDDSRHFSDVRKLALEEQTSVETMIEPVNVAGLSLGCTLCEDAWCDDYNVSPLHILSSHSPDLYINISCSPFTLNKNHKRNRVFSAHACRCGRPLIYNNNVGIQNNGKTVFCFDGSSCIYDAKGHQIQASNTFEEQTITFDIPLSDNSFGAPLDLKDDGIDIAGTAIEYGTRRFMEQCGVKRVTVGISGGIDSALVAAIYSRLLDPEDLLLVNMPSRYNSQTTRNLASDLAANLQCLYTDVSIDQSVELTAKQIDKLCIKNASGTIEQVVSLSPFMLENVQARDRSSRILSAISNAFGGVYTCNSNKPETTVGYCTLYGDLCGYFANIADLWKTEVYELAEHLNKNVFGSEIIPQGILDLIPSAELSDKQDVDKGLGDPFVYPYHDKLFKSWVEWWNRSSPEEALTHYADNTLEDYIGYDGSVRDIFPDAESFINDLERWWQLYKGMGVAKRIQAPPILAIKRRAFGFDHRESQMTPFYSKEYELLKKRLLSS